VTNGIKTFHQLGSTFYPHNSIGLPALPGLGTFLRTKAFSTFPTFSSSEAGRLFCGGESVIRLHYEKLLHHPVFLLTTFVLCFSLLPAHSCSWLHHPAIRGNRGIIYSFYFHFVFSLHELILSRTLIGFVWNWARAGTAPVKSSFLSPPPPIHHALRTESVKFLRNPKQFYRCWRKIRKGGKVLCGSSTGRWTFVFKWKLIPLWRKFSWSVLIYGEGGGRPLAYGFGRG